MSEYLHFLGISPDELTEDNRYQLGLSFFDASRVDDQWVAVVLGIRPTDALKGEKSDTPEIIADLRYEQATPQQTSVESSID